MYRAKKRYLLPEKVSIDFINKHPEVRELYNNLVTIHKIVSQYADFNIVAKGDIVINLWKLLNGIPITDAEREAIGKECDFIVFHPDPIKRADLENEERAGRLPVIQIGNSIQNVFPKIRMAERIETVRFEQDQSLMSAILSAICERSMTRHEIVAIIRNGRLVLYHTDQFAEAMRRKLALGCTGSSNTRLNFGEIVPLPGIVKQMLDLAVRGEVNEIYLPSEHVQLIWESALFINAKGRLEQLEPLGISGIQLCERYDGNKVHQQKLMRLLHALGLTRAKDFNVFRGNCEYAYSKKTGLAFEIKQRSFREVLLSHINARSQQLANRTVRSKNRDCCQHDWHTKKLVFKEETSFTRYCPVCKKFKIRAADGKILKIEELPVNRALINSDEALLREANPEAFRNVKAILNEIPMAVPAA